MNNLSTSMNPARNLVKAILITGLIAGALDGAAATISYVLGGGKNPVIIFNYIASGIFGREIAFSGGLFMAFLGLLFHMIIATGWTALYYIAYPKIPVLAKNKIVSGVFYGIFVWVMMNQVVVPLSNVPKAATPADVVKSLIQVFILIIAIGLPIAIRAHQYYSVKLKNSPAANSL